MAETKRTLLERIDRNLQLLLARTLIPASLKIKFGTPRTRHPRGTPHMADPIPTTITITDIEHVATTLEADDAANNPVPSPTFATPPAWSSSDPTVITVQPSPDGTSADVAATGKLGTARVTVSGVNAAGTTLTGIGDLTVVTSDATTFKLNFGTPAAK